MYKTSIEIRPRLHNDMSICDVKKKNGHEGGLDEEIQYHHLIAYYLLVEIQTHPVVHMQI
jgi:hypothetical protein